MFFIPKFENFATQYGDLFAKSIAESQFYGVTPYGSTGKLRGLYPKPSPAQPLIASFLKHFPGDPPPFHDSYRQKRGEAARPRLSGEPPGTGYFDVVFCVASIFEAPRLRKTWIEPSRAAKAVFDEASYITITSGSPSLFTSATRRS
jgi:hypothetical protein